MYKYETNKLWFNGAEVKPCNYWLLFAEAHGLGEDAALLCEGLATVFADHGDIALSTKAAKYSCMTGGEFIDSLIGWISVFRGHSHGGAVMEVADMLISNEVPNVKRTPGYGHHVHDNDPRVHWLLNFNLQCTKYRDRYRSIGKSINAPMNIAGAGTAAMLDAGFKKEICQFPFIVGRMIGISWHYCEEHKRPRRHA
jgi:citrate synthase